MVVHGEKPGRSDGSTCGDPSHDDPRARDFEARGWTCHDFVFHELSGCRRGQGGGLAGPLCWRQYRRVPPLARRPRRRAGRDCDQRQLSLYRRYTPRP